MKPLLIWLAGVIVVFGAFALVTNLVRGTDRVFVVVDSSFPMSEVWDRVPAELDDIDNKRYSEFALATEKDVIHTWRSNLALGSVTPFAPCGFDGVEQYQLVSEATEVILITTSGSCTTDVLPEDWTVIRLEP